MFWVYGDRDGDGGLTKPNFAYVLNGNFLIDLMLCKNTPKVKIKYFN